MTPKSGTLHASESGPGDDVNRPGTVPDHLIEAGVEMPDSTVQSDTGRFAMIPEWVLQLHLPPSTVAVYAVLALHADRRSRDGHPSRRTLSETTGCSLDTVDRAIKALQKAAALRVEPRRREDGSATSNRYILLRVKPGECGGVAATDWQGVAASDGHHEQSHSEQRTIPTGSRNADPACPQCQGRGVKGYALIDAKAGTVKDVPCDCTLPDYVPRPAAASKPPAEFGMPAKREATA